MSLTDQQYQAALLIAENQLTLKAIAKRVGVTDRTLRNWKADNREFQEQITVYAEEWRQEVRGKGIADPDIRLKHYNDRHKRLANVIYERAKDPQMQAVPGGKTGMLTVTYKMLTRMDDTGDKPVRVMEPVPEYAVDTATLAEMRALEQQAAIDLGQWKAPPVEMSVTLSSVLERRLSAAEMRLANFDQSEKGQTQESGPAV